MNNTLLFGKQCLRGDEVMIIFRNTCDGKTPTERIRETGQKGK